jgi:chromosome segregation protein
VTKLTDAMRFTNGLSSLPLTALPRISNCYVVNERPLGQELATRFPHCWFLTTDGVNYHGRAISGGKKTGAGPLALKRELREVSRLEEIKQRELAAAQQQVVELERAIANLAEHLEVLRSKQQAQEKDVLALDHESRKLAEELQRVHTRLSRARLELDRLSKDRIGVDEKLARDRATLVETEQVRADQDAALQAAREDLTGLQAAVAHAAEEHATLRANLASLEERRRALAASRARLESQVQEFAKRRDHLTHEMQRLIGERANFLGNNAELEARTAELSESVSSTGAMVNTLAEQEAELRTRLASAEEELKRLRTEAHVAQEKRSELQVALARAESDVKHLEETCQKELDVTLAQLIENVEAIAGERAVQELDGKYGEVRRKIEALGPVNPQALEEFEESQQRHDFLSVQRQDLLDSIRDTEKAIHEIDNESRKRFGEAFHAINENFREMFKVLFGGGIGEMRLTDEENLAESGIEIVASPPGKKLQSVLLLSGGEKSLTAMALLMGIFQYTPSPFCILDEVDAPLDEANIGRFTELVKEMSIKTQFVLITHSKKTMSIAPVLYGVTMQEPGVSKLVSVRFGAA